VQTKNTDIITPLRTVIGFWECTSRLVKRWMETSKVRIIFVHFYYSTLSYILVLLTRLFCASMACSIYRNAAVYDVYKLNWQIHSLMHTLFSFSMCSLIYDVYKLNWQIHSLMHTLFSFSMCSLINSLNWSFLIHCTSFKEKY
jgi:hypothetical protein